MVVIRLARGGRKKRPHYRVTVADQRRWCGGRFIEVLGHYNPSPRGQDKKAVLDLERLSYWTARGAKPTPRVKKIIKMLEAGGMAQDSSVGSTVEGGAKAQKEDVGVTSEKELVKEEKSEVKSDN